MEELPRDESISLNTEGAPLVSAALPSVAKGINKVVLFIRTEVCNSMIRLGPRVGCPHIPSFSSSWKFVHP